MPPLISICIPAKNRAELLKRLLDSIQDQTFSDYEVVITDNSDGDEVERLAENYPALNIRYHKNSPKTQMGGNWNACMQRATGDWLKLIHDDDWFTDENSLASWAEAARHTSKDFLFSSYYLVDELTKAKTLVRPSALEQMLLQWSSFSLLRKNVIGPPSVTLIRRTAFIPYAADLNWLVDIECYIRYLRKGNSIGFLPATVTSIGVHSDQATGKYFRNPAFEIPECLAIINPYYPKICTNIFAYDYCWRLVRNLHIRTPAAFTEHAGKLHVPVVFEHIIRFQARFSPKTLANGAVSKTLMMVHWLSFNIGLRK